MKGCRFKFTISLSLVVVIVLGIIMPTNAGDLNPPPGAIASTNCTQINEDAIGPLPFTISNPGCYVLTSNLTGVSGQPGIVIDADHVTLDLNGFALIGVAGSTDGVKMLGIHENIEVRSGTVTDWGGGGVNINDLFTVIPGFQGNAYPYGCLDDSCQYHAANPFPQEKRSGD